MKTRNDNTLSLSKHGQIIQSDIDKNAYSNRKLGFYNINAHIKSEKNKNKKKKKKKKKKKTDV